MVYKLKHHYQNEQVFNLSSSLRHANKNSQLTFYHQIAIHNFCVSVAISLKSVLTFLKLIFSSEQTLIMASLSTLSTQLIVCFIYSGIDFSQ